MGIVTGLGALLGPLLGGGLASTALKIGLAAAAIGVQLLLSPRPKQPRPDDLRVTKRSEEGPGRWGIGRLELEGQLLYGNTDDYDIYQIVLHAFGPLDQVEEYYYDGRPVIVDPLTSRAESPPFARLGGSYLHFQTKIGDGTETAWPDLVSAFSQWTADHRIRGIAQTQVWAVNPGTSDEKFGRMFQGGIKPVRLRARISLFEHPWDPRLNSGAGGRAWTTNAALVVAHLRTLLPGASSSSIDWTNISAIADDADALVDTRGGETAPRATLSGGGEGPMTADVVLDFLKCAGLEEVLAPDGKVRLAWLEDYPAAELHLTAEHIVSLTVQRGPEGVRRPNVCRVQFLSPERQYTVAELPVQTFGGGGGAYDGPAWARIEDEVIAYGEQETTIELPFCPDASQAQRIARRLFHMERADVLEIVTTFAGVAVFGARTIDVDVPDVGAQGATVTLRCRVEGWTLDDAAGQVRLICRAIPNVLQTAWNPATDEVEPPPLFALTETTSELETPDAPSAAYAVDNGGSWEMRVDFTGVTNATTAEANYRTYTAGEPDLWQGMTEGGTPDGSGHATVAGDFRGERVDFRVRFFDADDNASYFSPLLEVSSLTTGTPP